MNKNNNKVAIITGGAKNIGMDVYWHNRIGLNYKNESADYVESSLYRLLEVLDL